MRNSILLRYVNDFTYRSDGNVAPHARASKEHWRWREFQGNIEVEALCDTAQQSAQHLIKQNNARRSARRKCWHGLAVSKLLLNSADIVLWITVIICQQKKANLLSDQQNENLCLSHILANLLAAPRGLLWFSAFELSATSFDSLRRIKDNNHDAVSLSPAWCQQWWCQQGRQCSPSQRQGGYWRRQTSDCCEAQEEEWSFFLENPRWCCADRNAFAAGIRRFFLARLLHPGIFVSSIVIF